MKEQQDKTTIKLLAKKGLYSLLLAIPAVCNAGTVSLVSDVSRPTDYDVGKALTTSEMSGYTANEADGSSYTVVNYVGNVYGWGYQMEAALKFTLPGTNALLSTAKLHLPVINVKNSPTATITLTDDNAWQQTDASTTSTYPSLVNAKTLLSTQLVNTSGDVAFSLDTANLRPKIASNGTDITLIITGSTTADNYFNFVADDDASTDQAYLVLTFKPQVQSVSVPSNGTYKIGDALDFTVTFDSTVVVTGTPRIPVTLNTGGTVYASYVSGSASKNLVFRYTVASGELDADGVSLGSAISLNSGTIKSNNGDDAELNLYSVASTTSVLVDGIAPSISTVSPPSSGTYTVGQNLDYIVNFDDAVNVVISSGTPYLTLTIGSSTVHAAYVSGTTTSALKFRYTVVSGDLDADGVAVASNITLNSGTIKDAAGNDATLTFTGSTAASVLVDAVAPAISGVTGPSAGTYASGDTLWFTATLSENVTVTGSPYIPLTVGSSTKQAVYASGSGTTTLKFRYVLAAGDYDADGIATGTGVTLNGGAVQDAAGNDAVLSFPAPTTTAVLVDAVAPAISGVTGPSAGTYGIGDDLDFTVATGEDVTVTGSPYIGITVGGVAKTAAYASGSGTSSLVFRYTLVSGDEGTLASGSSITLDGGSIKDAAGNDLSSTSFTAPAVSGVTVDAVAPAISGVTGPSAGTYASGDTLWFTATFSEDVTVTGSPYIPLTVGSSTKQGVYASGSGTTLLKFRYVLSSGDSDANGIAMGGSIVLSTASIQDAAGNDATLTFTAPTTTAVLVDAITPTVFSVNPPDAGTYGIGDHLDFTVNTSEDVTVTGTPYIAITIGEETAKAVYVSGSGTSALTFRYTLVVGDAGTVSTGSSITLNGGAVQDAAGNEAVLTFTAPTTTTVLVDAVAPTISGVTGPSAGTYTSGDTLWFSVAFDEDVTVSKTPSIGLTIGSAARQALYVSGSGTDTLRFGYEVESGDEDADGIGVDASVSLNEGSIADDAGNAALLDLGTLGTEEIFVNNQPTIMVQKSFDPAGYSLRRVSSSGLFHVELPAGVQHAEIILLDVAGRRLAAKTLDASSSSMDVQVQSPARWSLAILRVDGRVKASARGGVPLR